MTAILIGLLATGATGAYGLTRPQSWSAEQSVVITPGGGTVEEQASLFDSLSRGQIAATAAEIYGQGRWHPDTPDVEVSAGVVAPSAVMQVSATGTDQADVEATLAQVLSAAGPELDKLLEPYQATILDSGDPEARVSGLSNTAWLAIAALAGLLVGAVVAAAMTAVRDRPGDRRRLRP